MTKNFTRQEEIWRSEFGEQYNLRNIYNNEDLDEVFIKIIGISKTEMHNKFLGNLNRSIKILEIGCNIGMMLVNLQKMGFENLYGIDIQSKAIEKAKERNENINFSEGSVFEIPFEDNEFDLVFTTHFLIHLEPGTIEAAMKEINRCAKNFIFGNEYYAEEMTEIINYHDTKNIAWKGNYSLMFSKLFPELELLKEENYKYLNNNCIDSAFLFKK